MGDPHFTCRWPNFAAFVLHVEASQFIVTLSDAVAEAKRIMVFLRPPSEFLAEV